MSGQGGRVVVDHQWHWFPDVFFEALAERSSIPRARRDDGDMWFHEMFYDDAHYAVPEIVRNLDLQLEQADRQGIDVVVVGPATLGEVLNIEDAHEAAELLDVLHREYARAQQEHPDRVVALATLPLQDPAVALEVVDRVIVDLGLRGVSVLASNEGRPVATDETLPVFRRINELGVPVVLHPGTRTNTYTGGGRTRAETGLGWMYHTALAALSFIDSGTLDECPNLSVLHPHLGGVLPYVVERIETSPGETKAKLPIRDYLRTRFYVDCAAPTPGALPFAIGAYGIDHVVFGSDYPLVSIEDTKRWLTDQVSPEQVEAIYANRVPSLKLPS